MTQQMIVTADPEFVDLALEELTATAGAEVTAQLAPGVFLIAADLAFADLARRWVGEPPVFVRHICPVTQTLELAQTAGDLHALARLAVQGFAGAVDRSLTFSVQTRLLAPLPYKPFDVNSALAAAVAGASAALLDVRAPQQVLSVVCGAGAALTAVYAFLGLSLAEQNLSSWAGGMRRFAREEGQVSRSEFKLLEALELFKVRLPERGVALDLGASPGGWTRVLRARGQYVTAVDPGELDPSIAADRGVRHLRTTAEAYLAGDPDRFDLIVNDMRMDSRDSARLMVGYARQLYPDGLVLMTLKLPERNRRPIIDGALRTLKEAYVVVGARQLFHNRSEITLYLRRKR